MNNNDKKINNVNKNILPLLPLKNTVVFPHMVIPIFIVKEKSIKALEEAISNRNNIFVVSQKDREVEYPRMEDLYLVGTIARIIQIYKLPDDTVKILIEGIDRAKIVNKEESNEYLKVKVEKFKAKLQKNIKTEALMRYAVKSFEKYLELNSKLPSEFMFSMDNIKRPDKLADLISSNLNIDMEIKQKLLEIVEPIDRLKKIVTIIKRENNILKIENKIKDKVDDTLEKFQKDYYLKEQLKEIEKELGNKDNNTSESNEFKEKILTLKLDNALEEKLLKEVAHLEKTPFLSAESGVITNYLECVLMCVISSLE